MNPRTRRTRWLLWGGLFLTLSAILLALLLAQLKLRMAVGKPLPVIGPVADFTLTNQNGRAVLLADLRGRVWVADVIFTRCPGPCPSGSSGSRDPCTRPGTHPFSASPGGSNAGVCTC